MVSKEYMTILEKQLLRFSAIVRIINIPSSITDVISYVGEIKLDITQACIIDFLPTKGLLLLKALRSYNLNPPHFRFISFFLDFTDLKLYEDLMQGHFAWVQYPPNTYLHTSQEEYFFSVFSSMKITPSLSARTFAGIELWAKIASRLGTFDINLIREETYKDENSYDLMIGNNLKLRVNNLINANPVLLSFEKKKIEFTYLSVEHLYARIYISEENKLYYCNWKTNPGIEKGEVQIIVTVMIITSSSGFYYIQDMYTTFSIIAGIDYINGQWNSEAGIIPTIKVANSKEEEALAVNEYLKSNYYMLFACNNPTCLNNIYPLFSNTSKMLTTTATYEGERCSNNFLHTGLLPNHFLPFSFNFIISQGISFSFIFIGMEDTFSKKINEMITSRYNKILNILDPIYYSENKTFFNTMEIVNIINSFEEEKGIIFITMNPILTSSFLKIFTLRKYDTEAFFIFSLTLDESDVKELIPVANRAGLHLLTTYYMSEPDFITRILQHYSNLKIISEKVITGFVELIIWAEIVKKIDYKNDFDLFRKNLCTDEFKIPDEENVYRISKNYHLYKKPKLIRFLTNGEIVLLKTSVTIEEQVVWSFFLEDSRGFQCDLTKNPIEIKEPFQVRSVLFLVNTRDIYYAKLFEIIDFVLSDNTNSNFSHSSLDIIYEDIGNIEEECMSNIQKSLGEVSIIFSSALSGCITRVLPKIDESKTIFINIGKDTINLCSYYYFSVYPDMSQYLESFLHNSFYYTRFVIIAPTLTVSLIKNFLAIRGAELLLSYSYDINYIMNDAVILKMLLEIYNNQPIHTIFYYGSEVNHINIGRKMTSMVFPRTIRFISYTTAYRVALEKDVFDFTALMSYFTNLDTKENIEFLEKLKKTSNPKTILEPEMIYIYNAVKDLTKNSFVFI